MMSICDLLRDRNTAEYGLAGAASIFMASVDLYKQTERDQSLLIKYQLP
jgi:hypothetical protein